MKNATCIICLVLFLPSCTVDEPDESAPVVENTPKTYPQLSTAVTTSFSNSILQDYSLDGSKLTIELREPQGIGDYYESGDKLNKLLAIEPIRMFYKIPNITEVEIIANLNMGSFHLVVTKSQAESFYSIDIDGMREYFDTGQLMPGDKWRTQFIQRFDEPSTRARFVQRFLVQ